MLSAAGVSASCRPFDVPAPRQQVTPTVYTPPPPLFASAGQGSVAPLGKTSITATGGWPPYAFAFQAPGAGSGPQASVTADGGYRAGAAGPVQDRIQVSDSDGGEVVVAIDVGVPLSLTPLSGVVQPGGQATFIAQNGQPPYAFSLASPCASSDGGAGGSAVTATGGVATYRAGLTCANATDSLMVQDSNGARAGPAVISVSAGVSLFPAGAAAAPGQTVDFGASGGVPPYTFSFVRHGNRSAGSITVDGRYTAGVNPTELDLIQAVDANGLVGQATVAVGDYVQDLGVVEPFTLYPADLYDNQIAEDLVASATYTADGSPIANQVEVFQGNAGGPLLPVANLNFPSPICGLPTNNTENGVASQIFVASGASSLLGSQSVPTCSFLQMYQEAQDGALATGPTLSSGNPDAFTEVTLAGGKLVLVEMRQQVVNDIFKTSYLTFFGIESGGANALDVSMEQLGEWTSPELQFAEATIAGRGKTIALVTPKATGQDSAQQLLIRLSNISLQPDGGVVVGATSTTLLQTGTYYGDFFEPLVGLADLNGDGLQDTFYANLSPDQGGTLNAFLYVPDAGNVALPPVVLPPAYQILSTATPSGQEVLDVIGPSAGLRLILEDGGLTWVDAGIPADSVSLAYGDYNVDGLPDLATVNAGGLIDLHRGEILGRRGTGNSFAVPPVPSDLTFAVNQFMTTGDFEGAGSSDVLIAGQGLTLMAGAGVDLLSAEGTLMSATVLAVTTAGNAGVALSLAVDGTSNLSRVAFADGGWQVTTFRFAQSDPNLYPTYIQGMSAGGPVPGGDLLVAGGLSDGGFGVVGLVYDPDAGWFEPAPGLTASFGGNANGSFLAAAVSQGGPVDSLLVDIGNPSGTDAQVVLLAGSPAGAPASWAPSAAPLLPSLKGVAPVCRSALTGSALSPLPISYLAHSRPNAVLLVPEDSVCTQCNGGCLLDPASPSPARGVFPTPGGLLGTSGQTYRPSLSMADVNGDGYMDLVGLTLEIADESVGLRVSYGSADGGFADPVRVLEDPTLENFSVQATGDFDGDGRTDLLLQNQFYPQNGNPAPSTYLTVLHGTDGGFE